ncbi:MAG: hypothetical protein IJD16_06120 [Desulfovibrio sp.]|nr:hypothetical protein [Desulfovibrio sp.]
MREFARRVTLRVTIDGHDVADAMAPYLLDFSFTDNVHGKADEVQFALHDRDGKWSNAWKPKKGMPVTATLLCTNWEEQGQDLSLPCGQFKVDEVGFSGPPDKITIKAVSSSLTGALRDTEKTRAWENTSLQTVAGQIAADNGLALFYSGDAHTFARADQRKESDLAFINRLASERAMNCKVHDGKLILFDAEEAESQDACLNIPKRGHIYSPVSYEFKDASSGTAYTDVEVAYTDPDTGKTHTATASAEQTHPDGGTKTLTYQQRAESAGDAMRRGRAQLHNANARERTASIECLGSPRLVAGRTIELSGFGDFDGCYCITRATHKLAGGQGYTTALELTKGARTRDGNAGDTV